MTRRLEIALAAFGFAALIVLHLDFWRGHELSFYFGWLPDELAYRVGWMALAWGYLVFFCARIWRAEPDEPDEPEVDGDSS